MWITTNVSSDWVVFVGVFDRTFPIYFTNRKINLSILWSFSTDHFESTLRSLQYFILLYSSFFPTLATATPKTASMLIIIDVILEYVEFCTRIRHTKDKSSSALRWRRLEDACIYMRWSIRMNLDTTFSPSEGPPFIDNTTPTRIRITTR